MNLEKLSSLTARLLFIASFGLLALAILEWFANVLGYTLVGQSYSAGRMLDFAAIFLIFVLAFVLRQIRDELKKKA